MCNDTASRSLRIATQGQEAETPWTDQGQELETSILDLHAQEEAKGLFGANIGSKG